MTRAEAASVLGVDPAADPAEVHHAFLRLARTAHPDTLPDADEPERRAAAERFDRILRARDVLLTEPEHERPAPAEQEDGWPESSGSEYPRWRPVPGRGLGGSLVVLALLAFLLVALVSLDEALRSHPFEPGSGSTTPATRTP
jgi:hypothetical protein